MSARGRAHESLGKCGSIVWRMGQLNVAGYLPMGSTHGRESHCPGHKLGSAKASVCSHKTCSRWQLPSRLYLWWDESLEVNALIRPSLDKVLP